MFPEFWEHITTKGDLRSEAEYQEALARDGYVGFYSSGDGVNTFRTPTQKPYVSGLRDGFSLNEYVPDAFQGHMHPMKTLLSTPGGSNNSPYYPSEGGTLSTTGMSPAPVSDGTNGDPRVADETRGKTIFGRWYVKVYDTVTNTGEADISKLINDVIRLQTEKVNYTDFISGDGWRKAPDGLVIQTGTYSGTMGVNINITFPLVFDDIPLFVDAIIDNPTSNGSVDYLTQLVSKSASGAIIYLNNTSSGVTYPQSVSWVAYGYIKEG